MAVPQLSMQIKDWVVQSEMDSLSDHFYITYRLMRINSIANRHRLLTDKGRHYKFKNGLKKLARNYEKRIEICNERSILEDLVENLLRELRILAKNCYKEATIKKRGMASWWSMELDMEKKRIHALRRRFQKEKDEDIKREYQISLKRGQAQYKKKIIKAREAKWRQFCTDSREAYGPQYKISGKKLTEPTSLTALANRQNNSQEELLKTCLEELFQFEDVPPDDNQDTMDPVAYTQESEAYEPITYLEIKRILSRLKTNKAAGHDAIDHVLLKRIFVNQPNLLIKLLNKCLELQTFPRSFKEGIVVLFLKPGRSPDLPKSYRPICLLPSIGKILERVIQGRMLYRLGRGNFWSSQQYGFKWGLSTEDALATAIGKLEKIRSDGEYGAFTSFDFKGAFDNLWWKAIITEIDKTDLPTYIKSTIRHYLSDRTVTLEENGIQVSRKLKGGCPQGSCLGPLLWNVVADTALKLSWSEGTHIQAYADDFAIITRGASQAELRRNTTEAITQFHEWAKSKRLTLNIEKCRIMGTHAIRGVGDRCARPVQIDQDKIGTARQIKYLGVHINEKLNWTDHCQKQITKVKEKFNSLHRFTGKRWGVHPRYIKIWYKTVAERILLYAASVWARKVDKRTIEKLTACQRVFLLASTRANRTAPTAALQVLSGIMPIELSMRMEEIKGRILRLNKNEEFFGKSWNLSDYERSENIWGKNPCHQTLVPPENGNEPIAIYTDGSKMSDGVGAAIAIYKVQGTEFNEIGAHMAQLRPENTVFQAELHAIRMAVEKGRELGKSFVIKSDSQSSILALKRLDNRHQLVRDILKSIEELTQPFGISWIKAHVGVKGNERADELAKKAIREGSPVTIKLPRSHIIGEIRRLAIQQWQKSWDSQKTGRTTFRYFPRVRTSRHINDRFLAQMYTGHGTVPEYLYRFKKINSPNCVCGKLGSWDHYMLDCPLTKKLHLGPVTQANENIWFRSAPQAKNTIQRLRDIVAWVEEHEVEIQEPA